MAKMRSIRKLITKRMTPIYSYTEWLDENEGIAIHKCPTCGMTSENKLCGNPQCLAVKAMKELEATK